HRRQRPVRVDGAAPAPGPEVSRAMGEKKAYPLRISAEILAAMQRWADDELRSLNAQIEYVLRDALRKAGRLPQPGAGDAKEEQPGARSSGGTWWSRSRPACWAASGWSSSRRSWTATAARAGSW